MSEEGLPALVDAQSIVRFVFNTWDARIGSSRVSLGTSGLRVLVADGHTLFRAGLTRLLDGDPRVAIVGQVAEGNDAVGQTAQLKPDIVLIDVDMPELDGFESTRQIVAADQAVKVLILTAFETVDYVTRAFEAGASGYILKDSSIEAVVTSLQAVANGECVMATSVVTSLLDAISGAASAEELYDGVSPRELEVLRLLARGKATKQIAFELRINEKTVRRRVSHLYKMLGIGDRSQALLYAIRKGLIEP